MMNVYTHTIPAGASVKIPTNARFIRGMASESNYRLRLDGGPLVEFGTGIAYESPETFTEVELFNDSAAAQTIKVAIAKGYVDDNRLVGQVDISGGIRTAANRTAAHGAVSVGVAAVLVVAENTARGNILVQNLGAADVYLGTSAGVTTANGILVAAGGGVAVLTITADIYAISGSAGNDCRYLEETL